MKLSLTALFGVRISQLVLFTMLSWASPLLQATASPLLENPTLDEIRTLEDYSLLPALTPGGTNPPDSFDPKEWRENEWNQVRREQLMLQESKARFIQFENPSNESAVITIETTNVQGLRQRRKATLSVLTPQYLIRNRLYRALGYPHPDTQHLSQLTLQFASTEERDQFKNRLEVDTFAAATRWVMAETETSVTLQDVVLSSETLGGLPEAEMVVLQALGEMPENLNVLSWTLGQPDGARYRLQNQSNATRALTEEELRRVLVRLSKLKRSDWEAIVRYARLPHPIFLVLSEKLISRAESLLEFYDVTRAGVVFDPAPNYFMELDRGVLANKRWPGYAGDFSYIAPKTPGDSQLGLRIRLFTRTRLFSLLLGYAVNKFNDLPIFHTDIDQAFEKHEAKTLAKMMERYNQTGEVQKRPLSVWGFGFAAGQLILSRDVVAGNIMGTNNFLQIIDQVGVRLNAGGQLNLDGGPHAVEADLKGDVAISRTYAHVKPIRNLAEANQPELRSLALPFLIRRSARGLDEANLKRYLRIGESLIITDSLVLNADLRASLVLYGFADLSTTLNGQELVLNRIHVYRKGENEFQFHQDVAKSRQLMFLLQAGVRLKVPKFLRFLIVPSRPDKSATFPILSYRFGNQNGNITTHFTSIFLNRRNMDWIRPIFVSGNTEVLNQHQKPYIIENEFKDKTREGRMLWMVNRRLKQDMDYSIESPEGHKRSFIRDVFAKTQGRDFERISSDALDLLMKIASSTGPYSIKGPVTFNPGFTVFGRAKNLIVQYEAEKNPDGTLKNHYAKLTHSYNGWKLKPKILRKMVKHFSTLSGKKIALPEKLEKENQVLLYQFSLHLHLTDDSIRALSKVSSESIQQALLQDLQQNSSDVGGEEEDSDHVSANENARASASQVAVSIKNSMEDFERTRSTKKLLQALSLAQSEFSPLALLNLLGGEKSIQMELEMKGITNVASESGPEETISQSSLYGTKKVVGPLSVERENLHMTEGEFFSQWLAGRVF